MFLALANLIERRLGNEYMTMLNQRFHVAIEERQQQRTDMRAIDIGIGHDDDFIVPALGNIEFFANTRSKSSNHRPDFIIGQYLIEPCLFHIDNFATERQDSLEAAIPALLCTAAGRITFDQINFRLIRILFRAIG